MVHYYQVDAFTNEAFGGNPAVVCVLSEAKDEVWMQQVATEMNVSETAFLLPHRDGYNLRWFTPQVEVELCGHATLASAHVLWEQGILKRHETARFFTKSGELRAVCTSTGITMDFPAEPDAPTSNSKEQLREGLGVDVQYVGRNRMDYLVEVKTEREVYALNPQWDVLRRIPARGIIVTSQSASHPYDFISRAFYPAVGILEDPVTGSAHCCLGPYWQKKLGRDVFHAYQASSRGGRLWVRVENDRVFLTGDAVTVMVGDILV